MKRALPSRPITRAMMATEPVLWCCAVRRLGAGVNNWRRLHDYDGLRRSDLHDILPTNCQSL